MKYWYVFALLCLTTLTHAQNTPLQQPSRATAQNARPQTTKATLYSTGKEVIKITGCACYLGLLYGILTNTSILHTGPYNKNDAGNIATTTAISTGIICAPLLFQKLLNLNHITLKNSKNKMHATFLLMLTSRIFGGNLYDHKGTSI